MSILIEMLLSFIFIFYINTFIVLRESWFILVHLKNYKDMIILHIKKDLFAMKFGTLGNLRRFHLSYGYS